MASKFLDKTARALDTALDDPDRIVEVPIPRLAEMLERFARIQRTAVGLTASGSITYLEMQGPKGASLRSAYETAAETDAPKQISTNEVTHKTNMRALLNDPEALASAQELVIRMMGHNNVEEAGKELTDLEMAYEAHSVDIDEDRGV